MKQGLDNELYRGDKGATRDQNFTDFIFLLPTPTVPSSQSHRERRRQVDRMVAASPQARKRLQKEYQSIVKAPPPFIFARPNEQNILEWHFIMRGPPDTPYHDGEYYGVVLFPHDYPFAPPGLKMNTPSGRFVPGAAICTSMSNFHPGSWNPGWSVQTILTGLLSFMVSEEITTGSLKAPQSEREALAAKSHAWNIAHPKFKSIFPEYSNSTMTDLPDMGPPPPAPPASSSDPTTPAKSTETPN